MLCSIDTIVSSQSKETWLRIQKKRRSEKKRNAQALWAWKKEEKVYASHVSKIPSIQKGENVIKELHIHIHTLAHILIGLYD